jgi:hypothetical protein
MDERRTADACRIGDLLCGFIEGISPLQQQYDSVAQAWESLVPGGLETHCRIAGFANGCLKVVADGSSYVYELQLCKAVLLRELQRLCPGARVRRIEVGMMR